MSRDSSVVRAARILDLLAHAEKPLPLTRVAESLGIPKSTAHSILRDLASEGFVEISERTAYVIGIKAFEVGAAHLRSVGAVGVIAPELGRLTSVLGVTSHYAVLDRTDVVYLCKEDPPGLGIQLASSIGARLPAHITAVGKASLAWLDPSKRDAHLDPDAGADPDQLDAELARVRTQGFSVDDGAASAAIQCVAAPVFDLTGPKGAIGVSYLRGADQPIGSIADAVCAAASRATSLLGGRHRR
jgi:DNA-binding IclR family transcriptional regulator